MVISRKIGLLTLKSLRMIWRSPSMRSLIFISTVMVFLTLYGMWALSRGQTLKFMTSNAYATLSFDMICYPGSTYQASIAQCKPIGGTPDSPATGDITPADILINILTTGSVISDSNNAQGTHNFAGLMSSIMMNGSPLLGLDDYVHLSDVVNENLGTSGRAQIMNFTGYSDRFGNFLDVRHRELRITPDNCWTRKLLEHLYTHSTTIKELKVNTYDSMEDAMKDCCDNVWAILELKAPPLASRSGAVSRNSTSTSSNHNHDPRHRNKNEVIGNSGDRAKIRAAASPKISHRNNLRSTPSPEYPLHSGSTSSSSSIIKTRRKIPVSGAPLDDNNTPWSFGEDGGDWCPDWGDAPGGVSADKISRGGPSLTIRMQPSSIPDTRNFEWSPRKSGSIRQQSGQLLYFLSGFLSLQMEVQNFLSTQGMGGPVIPTRVFGDKKSIPRPGALTKQIAEALMRSSSAGEVYSGIVNTTSETSDSRPTLLTPLYHRAFPTHRYEQSTFWHAYGMMITTALVVYFGLPAAVAAGALRREATGGHLDSLSTIPGIKAQHSATAWTICGALWATFSFVICYLFFWATLDYTPPSVPAVTLYLCGLALCPMAMALGTIVKRADALVVAVPTFVFVTMLPGLMYVDLAFDVQRSIPLELFMCLLPPSAAALVLRQVCGLEALFIGATWLYPAPISRTPTVAYTLVIVFDIVIYSVLATWLVEITHRVSPPSSPTKTHTATAKISYDAITSRVAAAGVEPASPTSKGRIQVIVHWLLNIVCFWRCCLRLWRERQGDHSGYVSIPSETSVLSISVPPSERSTGSVAAADHTGGYSNDSGVGEIVPNIHSSSGSSSSNSDGGYVELGSLARSLLAAGRRGGAEHSRNVPVETSSLSAYGSTNVSVGHKRAAADDDDDDTDTAHPVIMTLDSITKQYVTNNIGVVVLSEISASLRRGTVTCLLGSNGAGKTTMLKILCGLDSDYTGSVTLSESYHRGTTRGTRGGTSQDNNSSSKRSWSPGSLLGWVASKLFGSTTTTPNISWHNNVSTVIDSSGKRSSSSSSSKKKFRGRSIGWCPQGDALFDFLTVREHLELFETLLDDERLRCEPQAAPPVTRAQREKLIAEGLAKLGMTEHAHKYAVALSGGMRRRLSLALAFAGSPRVLLLDEPSSGCDSWTRELVRKDILSRKADCAILVSTHHIDDVEVLSDRVWFLNERYLAFDGGMTELMALRSGIGKSHNSNRNSGSSADKAHARTKPGVKKGHHADSSSGSGALLDPSSLEITTNDINCLELNFASSDTEVQFLFVQSFGVGLADQWLVDDTRSLSQQSSPGVTPSPSTGTFESHYGGGAGGGGGGGGVGGGGITINVSAAVNAASWLLSSPSGNSSSNIGHSGSTEPPKAAAESTEKRMMTWLVPATHTRQLVQLVTELERQDLSHWTVSSPTIHDALNAMYTPLSAVSTVVEGSEVLRQSRGSSRSRKDTATATEQQPQDASCGLIQTASPSLGIADVTATPSPPSLAVDSSSSRRRSLLKAPRSPQKPKAVTTSSERNNSKPQPQVAKDKPRSMIASFAVALRTALRQSYYITRVRFIEVLSHLRVFLSTQFLIPFFVVLAVVVGCRDINYPKAELTSSGSIGEVLVGVGPSIRAAPSTHRNAPSKSTSTATITMNKLSSVKASSVSGVASSFFSFSSLWLSEEGGKGMDKGSAEGNMEAGKVTSAMEGNDDEEEDDEYQDGLVASNAFVRTNSSHARWHRRNISDTEAAHQFHGYSQLVRLLGETTLRWVGQMNSDSLWDSLYQDFYHHRHDRVASFIISDTLNQWIESTVIVDQTSLNMSVERAFDAIQRAQEALCNPNYTFNGTASTAAAPKPPKVNDPYPKTPIVPLPPTPSIPGSGHHPEHPHAVPTAAPIVAPMPESHQHSSPAATASSALPSLPPKSSPKSSPKSASGLEERYKGDDLRGRNRHPLLSLLDLRDPQDTPSSVEFESHEPIISNDEEEKNNISDDVTIAVTISSEPGIPTTDGSSESGIPTTDGSSESGIPTTEGSSEPWIPTTDGSSEPGIPTTDGGSVSPHDSSSHTSKSKYRGSRAELCGKHPAVRIYLRNMTALPMADGKNYSVNTTAIVIRSYESMHSNLTMLSNVTNDHAAPMFLKEIAPAVYSSLLPDTAGAGEEGEEQKIQRRRRRRLKNKDHKKSFRGNNNDIDAARASATGASDDASRSQIESRKYAYEEEEGEEEEAESGVQSRRYIRKGSVPVYRLYSHPLPKINYTNQIYIERGYLGATIIVLYMLITTIISVRSVTQLRRTGVKLQLHMAGVLPVTYWCCNFVADTGIVLISLLSVYLAVYAGGEPISNYFLNFPPYGGLLFLYCICVFAFAVVASSYAFAVRSADQLSSQLLMLISTVAGGVFLKLFLDRHHDYPYTYFAKVCLWVSPCFAFSTCMFEMFDVHAKELSVKMGAVIDDEVKAGLNKVFHGIFVMFIQAVVYLAITVVLDSYWARIQAVWGHLNYLATLPMRYVREYDCWDRTDDQEDEQFDVSILSPTLHREGSEEHLNLANFRKPESVRSALLIDGIRESGSLSVTSPLLTAQASHRSYGGPAAAPPAADQPLTTTSSSNGSSASDARHRAGKAGNLETPGTIPVRERRAVSISTTATSAGGGGGSGSSGGEMKKVDQPENNLTLKDRRRPISGRGVMKVLAAYGEVGMFPAMADEDCGKYRRYTAMRRRKKSIASNSSGGGGGNSSSSSRGSLYYNSANNLSRGSFTVNLDYGDDDKKYYSSGDSFDYYDDEDIAAWETAQTGPPGAKPLGLLSEGGVVVAGAGIGKTDHNTNASSAAAANRISRRIVNVRELSVQYPNSSKMSLNGLAFRMTRGERVALMGMNGGGKSTLFKTLALAENVPVDGTLSVCGLDIVEEQWEIARACVAGYVPQDGGLFEFLSVRESFELFYGIKGLMSEYKNDSIIGYDGKVSSSRSDDGPWRAVIGTTEKHIIPRKYMHYLVHALSGGNKKKLSVAIANIASPAFLAMDECTSGVDPVAADRIVAYLRELSDHQGLLFASHRIDECISVCDRVLILAEGSAYFDGSVHAFSELASLFYQVDLVLPPQSSIGAAAGSGETEEEKKEREKELLSSYSPPDSYQDTMSSAPSSGTLAHPLLSVFSSISSVLTPLLWPPSNDDDSGAATSPSREGNDIDIDTNHMEPVSADASNLHSSSSSSPSDGHDDSTRTTSTSDDLSAQTRELLSLIASHCSETTTTNTATAASNNSDINNSNGDNQRQQQEQQQEQQQQRQTRSQSQESVKHSFACFERVVEYSPTLLRLTFEKRLVPLSRLWTTLEQLQRSGTIEKASFRTMDMEEALATIIASSKGL